MLHGIGATLARRRRPRAPRGPPAPVRLRARLRAARLAGGRGRAGQRGRPPGRDRRPRRCSPAAGSSPTSTGADGAARLARVLRRARLRAQPPRRARAARRPGERDPRHDGRRAGATRAAGPAARGRDRVPPRSRHAAAARARPACPTRPTSTTASSPSATSRAITLAALAPAPGQLLWDVGAGSGSIGIEWLRAEASRARDRRRGARRPCATGSTANALRARRPAPATCASARAPAALADLEPPGRGLRRRRRHVARPARRLLEGAASRRADRGQRRHARGRAGARRRARTSTAAS